MPKKETIIQKKEIKDNIERLLQLSYINGKRLMPLPAVKKNLITIIMFTHPTYLPRRWKQTFLSLNKQTEDSIDKFIWEVYLKESNLSILHGFKVEPKSF